MKLLICTQKVDRADPILGFFHSWITEFAKHCDSVIVICLEEGEHALPGNVRVVSLGKEKGQTSRIGHALRFLSLIGKFRDEYDAVFVHMNPEYAFLGGFFWDLWKKPMALWYLHKAVNLRLRLGVFFAKRVFTASSESFRLKTPKLLIVGHGIDTELFRPAPTLPPLPLTIVSVGRFAPAKHIEIIVGAVKALNERGVLCRALIAGVPATEKDGEYALRVQSSAAGIPNITFLGAVKNEAVPELLAKAHVFVNASDTGSLDKAVLEAMSAGTVPVTSNPAFKEMFEPHGLFVPSGTPEAFADVIEGLSNDTNRLGALGPAMRAIVVRDHSLTRLIGRLVRTYEEI